MKDNAWKQFFGFGWPFQETPTKRECFNAGYDAALESMKITPGKFGMARNENSPGIVVKTTAEIIKEYEKKDE